MDLKVGQIWEFDNRSEEKSFLIILKLETRKGQDIVHIAISGVAGHLPVQRDFVEKSLLELVSENNPLPAYEEGYDMWNTEFERGKAGVFAMTVKEIVKFLKDVMSQR